CFVRLPNRKSGIHFSWKRSKAASFVLSFGDGRHKHFIDAMAIQIHHFETPTLTLKGLPGSRKVIEAGKDKTRHGLVARILGHRDTEALGEIVDRHPTGDKP